MEKYNDAMAYYKKYISSGVPDDELKQYASTRLEELKEYTNAKANQN